MSKPENYLAVSFLPWAGLETEIKIGPVIFWLFNKMKGDKIKEQNIKEHLEKYFKCYVDHKGKPVNTITIASYSNVDFQPFDKDKYSELRTAMNSLLFAIIAPTTINMICENNHTIFPPSSEIFQLMAQNFRLGEDNIAVRAGSLLSGGWKIGEITFPKPWTSGGAFRILDRELFKEFNKAFDGTFAKDTRERIFRSLEWFSLAHVESEEVSKLSKVVMMTIAFEILLQFPRNRKQKYFVEYIEKKIASKEVKKDSRVIDKKPIQLSLAGCWAWDFYELRSRVVHGDSITEAALVYKDWITHLDVADLVFLECIEKILYGRGVGRIREYELFSKQARNFYSLRSINPNFRGIVQPSGKRYVDFNNVYKLIGWI